MNRALAKIADAIVVVVTIIMIAINLGELRHANNNYGYWSYATALCLWIIAAGLAVKCLTERKA